MKARKRVYVCDDGNCAVRISAESAEAAAAEYVHGGSWGVTEYLDGASTVWVHVTVRRAREADPERRRLNRMNPPTYRVAVHPVEPACWRTIEDPHGRAHDWREAETRGHGGGVVVRHECKLCGIARYVDTWATDPSDGTQGLESISYLMPDEVVR